jgi:hypothetical protein
MIDPTSDPRQLAQALGVLGGGSLGLIGCALAFHLVALQPMEARRNFLEEEVARRTSGEVDPGARAPVAKLGRFYNFFETADDLPTQLARLHVIGKAAGIEPGAAEYRVHKAGPRIVRYEIALPVSAGYAQIRAFLRKALHEIPMLSLDRISIRSEPAGDGRVQTDVRLTLHMVRS